MFYSKEFIKEHNERQTEFKFKDEYDVYEWNPKTKILEKVIRNYRTEIDNQGVLDIKEIINKTNQIPEIYSDGDDKYYDVSAFNHEYNFHDMYSFMNDLKKGIENNENGKNSRYYQEIYERYYQNNNPEISKQSVSHQNTENQTSNNNTGETK